MTRQLTDEEVNKLFEFCRKHYVYHYDLQVELVDHLASAIEDKWKDNPALDFNTALQNAFAKFGVTGFSKIKEQKRKELRRKYNNALWHYLFAFFTWPKILMTIAFTVVFSTVLSLVNNNFLVFVTYFGLFTIFIFYYYFKIFPKHINVKTAKGKKFLMLENLKNAQFMTMIFIQLPIQAFNFRNISQLHFLNNRAGIMIISFLIVLLSIALIGQMFYIPSKIKADFKRQFPEFAVD